MEQSFVTNGLGPDVERGRFADPAHLKAWDTYWLAGPVGYLRMGEEARYAFTAAATTELENNVPDTGCAGCMSTVVGVRTCRRPGHFANDPTYRDPAFKWTRVTYLDTDHTA